MLTHIKLENFKSWRNLDIELAPLTLLFGTNSSGKTAILQSLLLLKQTANNFDRKQHINFGGSERDYVNLGSWRDLVYGHKKEQHIRSELEWYPFPSNDFMIGKTGYGVVWRYVGKNDEIVIEQLRYDMRIFNDARSFVEAKRLNDGNYEYSFATTEAKTISAEAPESCYAIAYRDMLPTDVTGINFNTYFESLVNRIAYLGPIRESPKRTYLWTGSTPQAIGPQGENTIIALLASERQDTQLISKVARQLAEADLAYEFRIEPIDQAQRFYETRIKITEQSVYSSLLDVGFGVSQVLPVITLLFLAPEGSIILLEHPELHLHPNAQAHLADLLLHVAETRNLQLIVESHSEHLLTRLQRRIAEPEPAFANPDNIKMYFCQIKDGESIAESVDVDKYGQIKNWPENFFGDRGADLDAMTDAALARRREELEHSG